MIKKIKKIINGTGTTFEQVFTQYLKNKQSNRMYKDDFKNFARAYIPKVTDFELDSLFKHFKADSHML